MIEFEQKYKTPLAQRQYELEQSIKLFEVARAKNISMIFRGLAVCFGYLLIMGGIKGYSTMDHGYVLAGWLSILTCGSGFLSEAIVPYVEERAPNLRKRHADWIK